MDTLAFEPALIVPTFLYGSELTGSKPEEERPVPATFTFEISADPSFTTSKLTVTFSPALGFSGDCATLPMLTPLFEGSLTLFSPLTYMVMVDEVFSLFLESL